MTLYNGRHIKAHQVAADKCAQNQVEIAVTRPSSLKWRITP